jgi:hypothetical protein
MSYGCELGLSTGMPSTVAAAINALDATSALRRL